MLVSKKYRDQFEVQTEKTKNGIKQKVVYTGRYYVTDLPIDKMRRYQVSFKRLSAIIALLFIGMGFLNNDGSRVFYVVFPYVILFLPVLYMIFASITFSRKGEKLTIPDYEKSFVRLKTTGIGILVLSVASAVGDLVYVLSGHGNTMGLEILFIIGALTIAFCAFLVVQVHKHIQFVPSENCSTNEKEFNEQKE